MIFTITSIIAVAALFFLLRKVLLLLKLNNGQVRLGQILFWSLVLALPSIGLFIRFQEFDLAQLLHFLPRSGFIKSMVIGQFMVTLACFLALEFAIQNSKTHQNI